MKILIAHNSYQQPGGEDVVFDLERRLLEKNGHQVVTYHRTNHELVRSPLNMVSQGLNAIWSLDSVHKLSALLAAEKPDIVHVHNTFVRISPSIYSVCRTAGIPVVQTLHNYKLLCPANNFFRDGQICEECVNSGLLRSVQHGCFQQSRAATAAVALTLGIHRILHTWDKAISSFITPTRFVRRKFIDAGFPEHKIFVKPNFVSPDPLLSTPKAELSEYELPTKKRFALFVGRLSPPERIRTMIEAWARLAVSVQLVIVGSGPEQHELERLAESRGLSNVSFEGHLERKETLARISSAAFLIFPSEWYETFGLGMIEAFGCGVPVISSRLGAMEEIVDDGRTGLHFTPGDPQDLADKVHWAYTHPCEMENMGRAARLEYEEKYTEGRNYQILMSVYQAATPARSSSRVS